MAKGGARPGAGRKPGIPNKKNAERSAEIAASGLTPLDYMLSIMRDDEQELAVRLDAAKAAAQYVHPRLSAMEAKLTHRDEMTADELRRSIAARLKRLGYGDIAAGLAAGKDSPESKGRLN